MQLQRADWLKVNRNRPDTSDLYLGLNFELGFLVSEKMTVTRVQEYTALTPADRNITQFRILFCSVELLTRASLKWLVPPAEQGLITI